MAVPNEGPTARLLEGYLVELILRGATTDLTAHVRAREAWGLAVEKNLRAARVILEKPCVGTVSFCGTPSPSTDAAARERIDGLLDAGPKLGASLCDAAPALSSALGAADCARVATAYLFSMADKIGEPSR